jgi:hypothetical protein
MATMASMRASSRLSMRQAASSLLMKKAAVWP